MLIIEVMCIPHALIMLVRIHMDIYIGVWLDTIACSSIVRSRTGLVDQGVVSSVLDQDWVETSVLFSLSIILCNYKTILLYLALKLRSSVLLYLCNHVYEMI